MTIRNAFLLLSAFALSVTTATAAGGHGDHSHYDHGAPAEHEESHSIYTTPGRIEAIDTSSNRLTITHPAIADLGWPEMTMGFSVETPELLEGLKEGDQVRFDFRNAKPTPLIVDIEIR